MRSIGEIGLSKTDREAIAEASQMLRDHFPVERIVLFGSKARGTDDEESDIDLLVLTSRKLGWKERCTITDALFDLQLAYDVVISTLVVAAEEWDRGVYRVLPIHDEIEEQGVAA